MTLILPLLYIFCLNCQTSLNKNKSPNLWHISSILVCCIFAFEEDHHHKQSDYESQNVRRAIRIRTYVKRVKLWPFEFIVASDLQGYDEKIFWNSVLFGFWNKNQQKGFKRFYKPFYNGVIISHVNFKMKKQALKCF